MTPPNGRPMRDWTPVDPDDVEIRKEGKKWGPGMVIVYLNGSKEERVERAQEVFGRLTEGFPR